MHPDVDAIEAAVEGRPMQPKGRHNEDALTDFDLPAIVRGFIAINAGPATETLAIREAGFMPRLYATHQGRRVRVTMVSRLGDVGISYKDEEHGYFKRVSIYDLTDFGLEMIPGAPADKPFVRLHAITDAKGFWQEVSLGLDGGRAYFPSDVPVLYTEASKAHRDVRKVDPYGFDGLKVVPLLLTKSGEH